MSVCPDCGSRLVEVDNPLRREVRHPRGVECKPINYEAFAAFLDGIEIKFACGYCRGMPGHAPGCPMGTEVRCDCCEQPFPAGTRARVDPESGAIICAECYEALSS